MEEKFLLAIIRTGTHFSLIAPSQVRERTLSLQFLEISHKITGMRAKLGVVSSALDWMYLVNSQK